MIEVGPYLNADVVTAIATSIGTLAAIGALVTVALSFRDQAKASDLQSLITISASIDREQARIAQLLRGVDGPSDPQLHELEFFRFFNGLETLAAAINGRLFNSVSMDIAVKYLISVLASKESDAAQQERLSKAMDTPDTYEDLVKFRTKYRARIRALAIFFYEQQHNSGE